MKPISVAGLLISQIALSFGGELTAGAERVKFPVKGDETVTIFTSEAWPSPGPGGGWEVNIRGVVFEEEKRPFLSAALIMALNLNLKKLTVTERGILDQRTALFMVDNERGKSLSIRVGETGHLMPASKPNGHFEKTVTLTGKEISAWSSGGLLPLRVVTAPDDKREFSGCACVLPDGPHPLVISDIDDTIKITAVRNHSEAKLNTFCRPFEPVPGMATIYKKWAVRNDAGFCYVTGSPWQLYRPLERFREESGFPAGAWHMKHLRLADPETITAFFKPQTDYKLQVIEPLLAHWPHRPVVLAGDSGEQDPEIYATIARRHPLRVARIFIRNVTGESREAKRYQKAFAGIPPEKWQVFTSAAELPESLP